MKCFGLDRSSHIVKTTNCKYRLIGLSFNCDEIARKEFRCQVNWRVKLNISFAGKGQMLLEAILHSHQPHPLYAQKQLWIIAEGSL